MGKTTFLHKKIKEVRRLASISHSPGILRTREHVKSPCYTLVSNSDRVSVSTAEQIQ